MGICGRIYTGNAAVHCSDINQVLSSQVLPGTSAQESHQPEAGQELPGVDGVLRQQSEPVKGSKVERFFCVIKIQYVLIPDFMMIFFDYYDNYIHLNKCSHTILSIHFDFWQDFRCFI